MRSSVGSSASGPHVIDTYSGNRLDLDDPHPDQIALGDIAKVCRFGAQATRFHSVAQHAVLVMTFKAEALERPDLAAWALHHDSHEAYACDIPRPLKLKLRHSGNAVYDEICEALDVVIAQAVGANRPPKGAHPSLTGQRAAADQVLALDLVPCPRHPHRSGLEFRVVESALDRSRAPSHE